MKVIFDMQTFQFDDEMRGEKNHYFSIIKAVIKEGVTRGHDVIVLLNGSHPQTAYKIQSDLAHLLQPEKILTWHGMTGLKSDQSASKLSENINKLLWNEFVKEIAPDFILLFSFNTMDIEKYEITNLVNKTKIALFLYDFFKLSQYSKKIIETIKASSILYVASELSKEYLKSHLIFNEVKNIGSVANDQKCCDLNLIDVDQSDVLSSIENYIFCYYSEFDNYTKYLKVIEVYASLPESIHSKYKMIISGHMGYENKRELLNYIDFCGLNYTDIVLVDDMSDQNFKKLCIESVFTCFISTQGGFWSPIIEAMSYGAAIAIPESLKISGTSNDQYGLFDEFNSESIRTKFIELIENTDYLKSLSTYSRACADKYSMHRLTNLAWFGMEEQTGDLVVSQSTTFKTNPNKLLFFYNLIKNIVAQDIIESVEFPNYKKVSSIYDIYVKKDKIRKFIYIDVTNLIIHDHGTGIQRVSRNLLREYTESPPKGFCVLPVYCDLLDGNFKISQSYVKNNELIKKNDDPLLNTSVGDIFIGCDLNFNLANDNYIDVFRSTGAAVYIIVYDLLPLLLPMKYFSQKMSHDYSRWIKAISHATGLMCISKTVADELLNFLPAIGDQKYHVPLNIDFFPMGVDFQEATAFISEDFINRVKLQLGGRVSFLMVGTIEPRKGYMQALSAFDQLWREGVDVNLVIVGKKGWGMELFDQIANSHHEKDKRFFWFRNLNDAELKQVYQLTDCLIAASEGEGYGLPIIEAEFFKKPVIARDIPVFREVAGTYTRFFSNKLSVQSLVSAVQSFLVDKLHQHTGEYAEHKNVLSSWKDAANILWSKIQSKENYANYIRDRSVVIPAGHPDIDSPCMERTALCLPTKYCDSSYVMIGPNIKMNKGAYEVKIIGEINQNFFGHVEIVVYSGFGEKVLCHKKLGAEVDKYTLFRENIMFTDPAEGVGVRLVMHGRTDMVIRAISCIPL